MVHFKVIKMTWRCPKLGPADFIAADGAVPLTDKLLTTSGDTSDVFFSGGRVTHICVSKPK